MLVVPAQGETRANLKVKDEKMVKNTRGQVSRMFWGNGRSGLSVTTAQLKLGL